MAEEWKPKTTVMLLGTAALPSSKPVELQRCVAAPSTSNAHYNLALTSKARDEFLAAGAAHHPSFTAAKQACEKYLPLMYGFVEAIERNPSVRLNAPINFSWSSPMRDSKKSQLYTCYSHNLEVIMVLMSYGYSMINLAQSQCRECTTEQSFNETAPKIVKLLKEAAGVFTYVATQEIPRWTDAPPDRPAETHPNIAEAFALIALAAAQELMVVKGALTGTSPGILAKYARRA
eukprot:TRINITY_DN337_c0_g1_i1.p1 TRINITY_DN337_c0_g1~~TRINITY_DN337_c0_g1_i1.p1  ORF type:complete len:249 (+),score=55.82 TRINITY_DN337_c0_g1_i1:50-748(+)